MSKRYNENQKARLAVSLATGLTAGAWAKENAVPSRTVYRWARSPEVQELVQRIRARVIDRAIGRLTTHAIKAAEVIAKLSQEAESESVRLHASRAVLSDLLMITDYATMERRLASVERRIRASDAPASGK